ncbi:hypothetical protein DFH09DRAFT_1081829 [Mycena vulgaris]|nr:hypothetical protein DFH09DRAFT_1081829 [Mycena vulgaris]
MSAGPSWQMLDHIASDSVASELDVLNPGAEGRAEGGARGAKQQRSKVGGGREGDHDLLLMGSGFLPVVKIELPLEPSQRLAPSHQPLEPSNQKCGQMRIGMGGRDGEGARVDYGDVDGSAEDGGRAREKPKDQGSARKIGGERGDGGVDGGPRRGGGESWEDRGRARGERGGWGESPDKGEGFFERRQPDGAARRRSGESAGMGGRMGDRAEDEERAGKIGYIELYYFTSIKNNQLTTGRKKRKTYPLPRQFDVPPNNSKQLRKPTGACEREELPVSLAAFLDAACDGADLGVRQRKIQEKARTCKHGIVRREDVLEVTVVVLALAGAIFSTAARGIVCVTPFEEASAACEAVEADIPRALPLVGSAPEG